MTSAPKSAGPWSRRDDASAHAGVGMTFRLAHLADLHLGYRQYGRSTPEGINQREADVALAFRRALDGVIAAAPELIVVAGDHFHSVRPSNHAIVDAFTQWQRVRAALPETPVVIISGNHDTPRTSEAGQILKLFSRLPGFHVALGAPQDFRLGCGECAVHVRAVPESDAPADLGTPDDTDLAILVFHGDTPGVVRWHDPALGQSHHIVSAEQLAPWHYAALGHYHVCHQVGPRAWYAGSLEYTSTNPWDEARQRPEGKCWLLVTLNGLDAQVRPQPIPARAIYDLPVLDAAAGYSANGLLATLEDQLPAQLEGAIVRQVVINVTTALRRALVYEPIRRWKAQAMHYQLDLRSAPRVAQTVGTQEGGRPRPTVAEAVAAHLATCALAPDVDRTKLRELAERTLAALEASPTPEQEGK